MSFFNPFRKNAVKPQDERQEPTAGDMPGAEAPQAPAEPSGQPESGAAKVPPPWAQTEAPAFEPAGAERKEPLMGSGLAKSADDEGAAGVGSGSAAASAAPPAFEEVSSSSEGTYDPYGIAAQARAKREAEEAAEAREKERAAAQAARAAEEAANQARAVQAAAEKAQADREARARTAEAQAQAEAARREAREREKRASLAAAEAAASESVEPEEPVMAPVPREEAAGATPKPGKRLRAAPVPPMRELTDEELLARRRTKHRLIGAAILLMAVVVAAPFVLDSEKSFKDVPFDTAIPDVSDNSTTLKIPPVPSARKESGDLDVADSTISEEGATAKANLALDANAPVKAAASAEKPAAKAQEKAAAAPQQKPAAEAKKPEAKAEAASKTEKVQKEEQAPAVKSVGIAPPTGSGYYIQVMATSSEREAEKAVKRLTLLGLPAYRVALERKAATLWRVRIGLYKTSKEAEGVVGTLVLNGFTAKPFISKQ